jgi:hypothetical protein
MLTFSQQILNRHEANIYDASTNLEKYSSYFISFSLFSDVKQIELMFSQKLDHYFYSKNISRKQEFRRISYEFDSIKKKLYNIHPKIESENMREAEIILNNVESLLIDVYSLILSEVIRESMYCSMQKTKKK